MANDKEVNFKKYISVLQKFVEPLDSTEQVATQVYFLQFAQMHEDSLAKGDYSELHRVFGQLAKSDPLFKLSAMHGQRLIEQLGDATSTNLKAHYRIALDSLLEFLLTLGMSDDCGQHGVSQ